MGGKYRETNKGKIMKKIIISLALLNALTINTAPPSKPATKITRTKTANPEAKNTKASAFAQKVEITFQWTSSDKTISIDTVTIKPAGQRKKNSTTSSTSTSTPDNSTPASVRVVATYKNAIIGWGKMNATDNSCSLYKADENWKNKSIKKNSQQNKRSDTKTDTSDWKKNKELIVTLQFNKNGADLKSALSSKTLNSSDITITATAASTATNPSTK